MAEKLGSAVLELSTEGQKLNRELNSSEKSFKNWAGKIIAAVGGVTLAIKAWHLAIDAAKMNAEFRQIHSAFSNMARRAGQDADEILDSLNEFSGETINQLDLVRSASKATLLGIPVDQFDDLMKIARASATATGQDVRQMFDDIVTGIGRASPLILDNLGITVKIGAANEEYAKALGKTVEELTATEKKQAILNAVLKSGERIMRDVGEVGQQVTDVERWQQLGASMDNLKITIGETVARGLRPMVTWLTDVIQAAAASAKEINKINQALKDVAKKGEEAKLENRIIAEKEAMKKLRHEIDEVGKKYQEAIVIFGKLWAEQKYGETLNQLWDIHDAHEANIKLIEDQIKKKEELAEEVRRLADEEKKNAAIQEEQRRKDTAELARRAEEAKEYAQRSIDALQERLRAEREAAGIVREFHIQRLSDFSQEVVRINDLKQEYIDAGVSHVEAERWAAEQIKEIRDKAAEAHREVLEREAEAIATNVHDITSPVITSIADAINKGTDVWEAFSEAAKDAVAKVLQALSRELAIWGAKALIPIPGLFNPAGAAAAFAGSVAALAGASWVRHLEHGGVIDEPVVGQGLRTGKTYSFAEKRPEEVRQFGGSGQIFHITFQLGSRTLFDEFTQASRNGQIIISERSIGKR